MCKFGQLKADQDNLKLVRGNVQDLYEKALEIGELSVDLTDVNKDQSSERELQTRLAGLRQ